MHGTANTRFFFEGGLCYLIIVGLDICGFDYSQRLQRSMSRNNLIFTETYCEPGIQEPATRSVSEINVLASTRISVRLYYYLQEAQRLLFPGCAAEVVTRVWILLEHEDVSSIPLKHHEFIVTWV